MANTPNLQIALPIPLTTTSWGSDLNPASGSTSGPGLNWVFNEFDSLFNKDGTGKSVGLNVNVDDFANPQILRIAALGTIKIEGTFIAGTGEGGATPGEIVLRASNTGSGTPTYNDKTGANLRLQAGNGTGTGGSGNITFFTATPTTTGNTFTTMSERMRIDNKGNVNIAATGKTQKLYVNGNSASVISAIGSTSGTITLDMANANNFSFTLNANATNTLANPTNFEPGQSGVIYITQDATGSRTLAYGSFWKFTQATAPTLSTLPNAVDVLTYTVQSATQITASIILNMG